MIKILGKVRIAEVVGNILKTVKRHGKKQPRVSIIEHSEALDNCPYDGDMARTSSPGPFIKHCTAAYIHYNKVLKRKKKGNDLKARSAVFLINM